MHDTLSASTSDAPLDVIVVGSGPAAATAARLLTVLEHRVLLVAAPSAPGPFDPHIVLPLSALRSFGLLGLNEAVRAVGWPIRSSDIRWGDSGASDPPGRDSGFQVPEHALAGSLLGALGELGVAMRHDVVTEITPPSGPPWLTEVAFASGDRVRTRLVICTVPGLMPDDSRPRTASLGDAATSVLVTGVGDARMPRGHHHVETFDDAWAWALRHDEIHAQLTLFHDPRDAPFGRPIDAPALAGASSLLRATDPSGASVHPGIDAELTRPIRPSVPGDRAPVGTIPIGRAAFGLSPLSSLGTSLAVQTAHTSAAVAAAILGDDSSLPDAWSAGPDSIWTWYRRELTKRALRTHALTTLACREPGRRHGTAFWSARATDWWREIGDADLVEAAARSRWFVEASQSGEILDAELRLASDLEDVSDRFQAGPTLRVRPAVRSRGGLPIARDDWLGARAMTRLFETPATLGSVLTRLLDEVTDGASRDTRRKTLAQTCGRFVEAGLVVRVGSGMTK